MGEAQIYWAWYICEYVVENEIGEKGCRHFSKAVWGELKWIYQGHCSITQGGTKSGTGDAGISAGEPG